MLLAALAFRMFIKSMLFLGSAVSTGSKHQNSKGSPKTSSAEMKALYHACHGASRKGMRKIEKLM